MSQPGNNSDHVPEKKPVPEPAPVAMAQAVLGSVDTSPANSQAKEDSDRRSWPRRKRAIQVVLQDAAGHRDPFPAWVMDRSIGGLGLSVDEPIEEGTLLRVRRAAAPTDVPWVDIQVKSVRIKESTWELGCQFTRSLTWDVLMQFG
jgi:PilZ domain